MRLPKPRNFYKKCLYLLILTLANYWIWQILLSNLVISIVLLIIEFGIFVLITLKELRKHWRDAILISVLLLTMACGFILRNKFDKTLLTNSPTEINVLNERHGILANGLGIIFTNRYAQHYYLDFNLGAGKYLRNVFYTLDPNLYFFQSHPREKAGIVETNKYSPFVLPLFVIGILFLIIYYRQYLFLIAYFLFALVLTGFLSPAYNPGPVLMFPFMNIVLYLGLTASIPKIKLLFKK
ncbi:MAG: hypothetical protein ABSE04_00155 [Candidatus Microgenomates bacterium]|jgi:hypothetical protein